MARTMILRGGRIIDPANNVDRIADLTIQDGRIAPADGCTDAPVVDVSGLLVCPGFIDLHVHLREPGQTHKEDIASGSAAAAAGGFTTVVAMPNTLPPIDNPDILAEIQDIIRNKAAVNVLQSGALTEGRRGKRLTNATALAAAGAVALTDDGSCIQAAGLMLEAVRQAKAAGLPVIDHCEDDSLAAGGAMNAGEIARSLGVSSQPNLAEEVMVARDILIAAHVGWPVHIQHISAAGSVELVRAAQKYGIPVSAEAAPHHLCFTHETCVTHGANAKMNPPLRTEEDRLAVIAGLADGTISSIATDHAPHTADEKSVGMEAAPCGIIGLEAAVALCLDVLVHRGALSMGQFVAAFTSGPRRVLGLQAGTLSPGMPADVTIIAPDRRHILRTDGFHSRSLNCPYDGRTCTGQALASMVGGTWAYSRLPGVTGRVR